jgi:hypothetical protein
MRSRSIAEKAYTRLPSIPVEVTMNSPRRRCSRPAGSGIASSTDFNGWPAKRPAKCVLQPTSKPQFDGRSGAEWTPRASSSGTQAPSEPSRGQLAPPSARTTASALTSASPSGASKTSFSSDQPRQRWRMWKRTPAARSRWSQARSSGAAFIPAGNTRPELPTKVSIPSAWTQSTSAEEPMARSIGSTRTAASP